MKEAVMQMNAVIKWLLKGDVSIQYQTYRDLFNEDRPELRDRISTEGWGRRFLSAQHSEGHWGQKFYQPKWTSTHYTLLDLRNLNIVPQNERIRRAVADVTLKLKGPDGGILPIGKDKKSDVCVNGMFLNYASYFKTLPSDLQSVVDFLLSQKMEDGGFNCQSNRSHPRHSSLHSTISVLEGFSVFKHMGYTYRIREIERAISDAVEFILCHRLFLSDRTGKVINPAFLRLPYPSRWRYDILRAMDYFQFAGIPFDKRMQPALNEILKRRDDQGFWKLYAPYAGKVHFHMEATGAPSRWNTLRALRVFRSYPFE